MQIFCNKKILQNWCAATCENNIIKEKVLLKLCRIHFCTTIINLLWPSDVIWWSGSTLAQVMVCYLMVPSHSLSQCWLIISETLWHSLEGNFTGNAQDIYPQFEFEITDLYLQLLHLPGYNELNVNTYPALKLTQASRTAIWSDTQN